MAKGGSTIRVSNKNQRNTFLFDFQFWVNSKDGVYLMPYCLCNVRVTPENSGTKGIVSKIDLKKRINDEQYGLSIQ